MECCIIIFDQFLPSSYIPAIIKQKKEEEKAFVEMVKLSNKTKPELCSMATYKFGRTKRAPVKGNWSVKGLTIFLHSIPSYKYPEYIPRAHN